ncbi:MAG: Mini-ribonuclease 3 [Bacillota bacterium]
MLFFDYEGDPAQLPSLTLAYIGDAVYELYIRTQALERGNVRVQGLHKESVKMVNAKHQAKLLERIEGKLTEMELAVARRGRNAKSGHVPKNTEVTVYRRSTGFEALIGYLFLKREVNRILELLGED